MSRFLPAAAAIIALLIVSPSGAREVRHSMGVTEVPDEPLRIVALTNEATEDLVALGIVPVGAARSANSDPWYEYLENTLVATQVVGEEVAPNLEVIAALQPDLILGNKRRHEKVYDQLSAIAPTVFAETILGTWKENFALYADAVGLSDEGERLMAAYEAKAEGLRHVLGEQPNQTVTLVRFLAGQVYLYNNDSFSGVMVREAGLSRPEGQDKAGLAELITKERIADLAAGKIIYFNYETGDGGAVLEAAEWTSEPLWQNLPAVKSGQVHQVSDAVWATAGGIMAAGFALDDLAAIYDVTPR